MSVGIETRICQNCKTEFIIEPEDFAFYEKIKVPPPTWCPECRMIRRMVFRNLRFLYKRRVLGSEKEVHSAFAPGRNSYDMSIAGGELNYEIGEAGAYNSKFVWYSGNTKLETKAAGLQYSMFCFDCMNVFGCVGLKKKSYCILNKQYTKEEYGKLVPRIVEHMNEVPYKDNKDRVYRYGEFFPVDFSPFAYNETIAQDYFPLTQKEALVKGYKWREREKSKYKHTTDASQLPDHIDDVQDSPRYNPEAPAFRPERKGECRKAKWKPRPLGRVVTGFTSQ